MSRLIIIIAVLLVAGCAGSAYHQRYTWTGDTCPLFSEAVRGCIGETGTTNILSTSGIIGVAPAARLMFDKRYEGCMKQQGYQQVGNMARVPEKRAPQLWLWQVSKWPWPESPPASAWTWAQRLGGVDYVDAVCVMPAPAKPAP